MHHFVLLGLEGRKADPLIVEKMHPIVDAAIPLALEKLQGEFKAEDLVKGHRLWDERHRSDTVDSIALLFPDTEKYKRNIDAMVYISLRKACCLAKRSQYQSY